MINSRIKAKIISYLNRHSIIDCSASMISRKLKLNRLTTSKYLKVMEAQDEVSVSQIGMAKVWKLNESPILSALQSKTNGNGLKKVFDAFDHPVHIINKDRKMYWHNKSLVKLSGKKDCRNSTCYGSTTKSKTPCKNCPAIKTFELGVTHQGFNSIKDKKGVSRHFQMITSPIFDSNKKVVAVIEQIIPISQLSYQTKLKKEPLPLLIN